MMAAIGVLLACVGLVVLGLVLGAFAACIQSSTISRMEEAMGRGDARLRRSDDDAEASC